MDEYKQNQDKIQQLEILTYPDTFLTQLAEPVENIDGNLVKIFDNMAFTMYGAPGIGLAAPQVGIGQRFLIFDISPKDERDLRILVNPKILSSEGEIVSENEGCLSVPEYRTDVKRFEKVLVEGYDGDGNPLRMDAEGLLAIVLQHEIDHLEGKLFIDRISPLKRQMYKRRVKKSMRKA